MIRALGCFCRRSFVLTAAVVLIVSAATIKTHASPIGLPAISANENRVAAGTIERGVASVSLAIRRGVWYPDGPGTLGVPIAAFGELGKPLQIPGPLVRVPAGTNVEIHLRNELTNETLHVHGLSREGAGDTPIVLRAGEDRVVSFRRDTPGTYGYWASDRSESVVTRFGRDAELSGAIVIDDPRRARLADRVFVINQWVNVLGKDGSPNFTYELETLNGRAWPATERLEYRRGQTVRWRVFNASLSSHPMHLHGFPFVLDAVGDGLQDVSFAGRPPLHEVTHVVDPGTTFAAHWVAGRPGTWMFHCHIAGHIIKHAPVEAMIAGRPVPGYSGIKHAHQPEDSMGGMILAVHVTPLTGDVREPIAVAKRHLALDVVDNTTPGERGVPKGNFAYVLRDGDAAVLPTGSLGPQIVLDVNEPTAIRVTNHLPEATAVHWHGIEVQSSYNDGATGMGDMSASASPSESGPTIEPGQTFEARFTPHRAGTFMYHTHMDDLWQLLGGLAGPLIVLGPGERFDAATDHVVMVTASFAHPEGDSVSINGSLQPAPIVVHAGVPQRLRLLNMTAFNTNLVASLDGVASAEWTPIAKDGIDLDARSQIARKPIAQITIGETRDFRFVPQIKGPMKLDIFDGTALVGSVAIDVRE